MSEVINALEEHSGTLPGGLRVVRELDHEHWASFVRRHPHGSIFHTPEMHRVLAETRNYRPSLWAVVDGTGEICALMTPVEIATLGGPLRLLTSRSVSFAGPLVASGAGKEHVLATLLDEYQRRSSRTTLFTEIRHHTEPSEVATQLAAAGFRHEHHLNFFVDLTLPKEVLWRRVSASARRNVKKARRSGVTVEEAIDEDSIKAGYDVLRNVYRRIRVPLPDRSLFDAATRVLGPLGWFKFLIARLDDRPIGVLTLLLCKDVVYYWYTGTLREFASFRAGDLLVWHAIEQGRMNGYRTLDFGGAGRPDETYGVRDFKAKYGGRLVDFGRDVWRSAPVRLQISTAGFALTRRFL